MIETTKEIVIGSTRGSATVSERVNRVSIPIICFIGASSTLDHLPIKEWREIRPIARARPFDRFCGARINGDSLAGDRICDGDYVIVRITFDDFEITPGRLCAVLTPFGLLVKHVYPTLDGRVRLVSSNVNYSDLIFDGHEVTIQGIVVRVEWDL